ncbi:unnamed protein product, partial [Mesorhabditis belari]|uniref:Bestrophin homolog n=1 Tax=Mesorhabditis belari TaxID=2138241 RepID=A0AAF3EQ87_9BILA
MDRVWRDVPSKIRLRFPKVRDLITAGLLTDKEYTILEEHYASCTAVRWMAPLHWVQQILQDEVKDNNPTTSIVNNFVTGFFYVSDWLKSGIPMNFDSDWDISYKLYKRLTNISSFCEDLSDILTFVVNPFVFYYALTNKQICLAIRLFAAAISASKCFRAFAFSGLDFCFFEIRDFR